MRIPGVFTLMPGPSQLGGWWLLSGGVPAVLDTKWYPVGTARSGVPPTRVSRRAHPARTPGPTGSPGLEDPRIFLFPPPMARQEAPSDRAWTAAQWAFGHLLNGLRGWEVKEHWAQKGPQRSGGRIPPLSAFGSLLGGPTPIPDRPAVPAGVVRM